MKTVIYDIRLDSVNIDAIPKLDENDELHIRYKLVYPRAGTSEVERTQTIKLSKTKLTDQDDLTQSLSYSTQKLPFDKRIVFKEKIHGESMLRIEVLALDKPWKLGKFIIDLMKGALDKLFEHLTGTDGVITNANAAAVLEKVKDDWLIGNMKYKEEGQTIQLGAADVSIDAKGTFKLLRKNGQSDDLDHANPGIILTTTEKYTVEINDTITSITESSSKRNNHGVIKQKEEVLIPTGKANGSITLKIVTSEK